MGRSGRRTAGGQSVVELALILPIVLMLLLGATDFVQVVSVQQRLTRAAQLATLRLLTSTQLNLPAFIEAESGLTPVTAGASYALGADGSNHVVVSAAYDYPLLMPGVRDLQTGSINHGKLHVAVQAAGIAVTSPPVITKVSGALSVAPAGDGTVPASLALTCRVFQGGALLTQGACSASSPLVVPSPATAAYTATAMQVNGVVSPASTPVSWP